MGIYQKVKDYATKKKYGSSSNTSGGYSVNPYTKSESYKPTKEERREIFFKDRERNQAALIKAQDRAYEKELAVAKEVEKKKATLDTHKAKSLFDAEQRAAAKYGPREVSLFGKSFTNIGRVQNQAQEANRQRELQRLQFELQRQGLQAAQQQYQQPVQRQVIGGQYSQQAIPAQQPSYQGGFNAGLSLPNANLSLPNSSLSLGMSLGPSQQQYPEQGYSQQPQQVQQYQQVQRAPVAQAAPQERAYFRRFKERYGYSFRKLQPGEQLQPGESLFERNPYRGGFRKVA